MSINKLSFLFKNSRFYHPLRDVFSSGLPAGKHYEMIYDYVPPSGIILNLGSGSKRLSKKIINVDLFSYRGVDVVADVNHLPFKDNSVIGVINIALLEHLSSPTKALTEINRVLARGGYAYSIVPFIQGFHGAPFDYTRWTKLGLEKLFSDVGFEKIRLGAVGGPTSAFLWVFQEWLAILLSFNIKYLYLFFLYLFMLLTFPLKYLDIILNKYKFASNITSCFYYLGRKS